MSNSLNSKERFSSRVADYVKFRPGYPRQVLEILLDATGLAPDWVIADVGCGTGISCRMFLENGNPVFGVEPNDDMRAAAEIEFSSRALFHPVKGTAEATTLPDESIDLVVAAQAYHWFDRTATAREFRRVLRGAPGGWVAVIWNERRIGGSEFALLYDQLLLRYGTDYKEVSTQRPMGADDFRRIFGAPFRKAVTPNHQDFTLEGLFGRVRSASYAPLPGQPGHDQLYAGLREIFDLHQQAGQVRFDYETEVFWGRLR